MATSRRALLEEVRALDYAIHDEAVQQQELLAAPPPPPPPPPHSSQRQVAELIAAAEARAAAAEATLASERKRFAHEIAELLAESSGLAQELALLARTAATPAKVAALESENQSLRSQLRKLKDKLAAQPSSTVPTYVSNAGTTPAPAASASKSTDKSDKGATASVESAEQTLILKLQKQLEYVQQQSAAHVRHVTEENSVLKKRIEVLVQALNDANVPLPDAAALPATTTAVTPTSSHSRWGGAVTAVRATSVLASCRSPSFRASASSSSITSALATAMQARTQAIIGGATTPASTASSPPAVTASASKPQPAGAQGRPRALSAGAGRKPSSTPMSPPRTPSELVAMLGTRHDANARPAYQYGGPSRAAAAPAMRNGTSAAPLSNGRGVPALGHMAHHRWSGPSGSIESSPRDDGSDLGSYDSFRDVYNGNGYDADLLADGDMSGSPGLEAASTTSTATSSHHRPLIVAATRATGGPSLISQASATDVDDVGFDDSVTVEQLQNFDIESLKNMLREQAQV